MVLLDAVGGKLMKKGIVCGLTHFIMNHMTAVKHDVDFLKNNENFKLQQALLLMLQRKKAEIN